MKKNNYPSSKYILTQRPIKAGKFKLYQDGQIKCLYDTLNGKLFGNYFEFDPNSNLITYAFRTDSNHSTYTESFNPEKNELENIEGQPIVYIEINADRNRDSLFVEYLVSNFSWEDVELEVSENGVDFRKIALYDHKYLKFIKIATFAKDSRLLPRFYLIAKFSGKQKVKGTMKTFYDTIDATKRRVSTF